MDNRYIMVPYEIIDEAEHQELIIALYIYLMYNYNAFRQVYTSPSYMLHQCGYGYNNNSKSRGHFEKISSAINWLIDNGYIWMIEDPVTGNQDVNICECKPNQHFNIELSEKCFENLGKHVRLHFPEYEKMHFLFFDKDYPSYRKLVNLFFLILQNVHFEKGEKFYYYVCTIDKLVDKKAAGTKATIYKLIAMLEEIDLLHGATAGSIKAAKFTIAPPHVFIRHSDNWENELEYAVSKTDRDRNSYFKLKGVI